MLEPLQAPRGFEQHDTHEFLCSLMSLLHEDLNRVTKKPYYESALECAEDDDDDDDMNSNNTNQIDSGSQAAAASTTTTKTKTRQVADESWRRFLSRDDSIVVDNFYGQFKSKLTCPECHKVSVTFEPFNNLIVPLPKPRVSLSAVLMFSWRRCRAPLELSLRLAESDTMSDVSAQLVHTFAGLFSNKTLVNHLFSLHKLFI